MPNLSFKNCPALVAHRSQELQKSQVDLLTISSLVFSRQQPREERKKVGQGERLPQLARVVVEQLKEAKFSQLGSKMVAGTRDNAVDRGGGEVGTE